MSRSDAFGLIEVESAERLVEPGQIEIRPSGLEVISKGEDDPQPRLISKLPERERKLRWRPQFPPNLLLGHCLPSR